MGGGIACFSPGAAFNTLLGSLVGAVAGFACCSHADAVAAGLWGYNSALTALSVSIFFVPLDPMRTRLLACAGASVAALLNARLTDAMTEWVDLPTLTLPFCITASLCVLIGGRVP